MSQFFSRLWATIMPFIGMALFIVVLIIGIIFVSYILIILAIIFFILFVIGFIRMKFASRKSKKQDDSQGRTINHDDKSDTGST
jgi:ABC-type transport system involved in cytochrome bd biosynthesis fused ATPase/permease subunit